MIIDRFIQWFWKHIWGITLCGLLTGVALEVLLHDLR